MRLAARITAILAGAPLALGSVACSPSEVGVETVHADDPAIILSEGRCDQTCPVYDMTLKPDGSYLLNGVRFVKTPGVSDGGLGADAWAAAEKALSASNFWFLAPNQTSSTQPDCVPGTPTVAVTWRTADGKQKTLNYRAGCGGPEGRALIPALRAAMQFDTLVWTEDRFAPDGSL
jgi:hypothetical protein